LKVRIAEIEHTFVNYPEVSARAVQLFIEGCPHGCCGCHNEGLQGFGSSYTKQTTVSDTAHELRVMNRRFLTKNKLVIMGGEPLSPNNRDFTLELLSKKEFDVTLYTGYTQLELIKAGLWGKLEGLISYLKVGRFDQTRWQASGKTSDYFQLASSNQELYNSDLELISYKGRYEFVRN